MIAVAAACSLMVGCGKTKTVDEYIRLAQADQQAGNLPAAVIELKNALQQDTRNIKARLLLGELYVTLGDGVSAEAELARARQDGAGNRDVAKPLAQAELLQGKVEQALEQAKSIDNAPAALKAGLLSVQADAYMARGQLEEARRALESGLESDPNSVDVLSGMVRHALMRRDTAEARRRLDEAQKLAPKDIRLVALQGAVAMAADELDKAAEAYRQVIKTWPWSSGARLGLARVQVAANRLKDADETLAVVLKSAPKNPNANYIRALSAFRGKDYQTALSYSQRTLAVVKDYMPALLLGGAAAYALHNLEQSHAYLAQYVYAVPENVRARKLLATVQMQLGHSADAVKTLSSAAADTEADPELLAMIGTASARAGDLAEASRYLRLAIQKQPDNAALHTQLGATQIALGQTDAGIEELEKASRQDPKTTGADIALIEAYLRDKDYAKALGVAERLQAQHPKDPVGFSYAGVVYRAKGDHQAAEKALLKARELRPGDPMALENLAALAIEDGKSDLAAQYYGEVLKANPKETRAYLELAALQTRNGNAQQAQATLEQAIQQVDNPAPRVVLARMLLLQGKGQEALNTIRPALDRNPREPTALEVAGRAQLALGQRDAGIATLKTLADVLPKASYPHRELAQAYLAARDLDPALVEAKRAVALDPRDAAAKLALASVQAGRKDYDQARALTDELAKSHPQDPAVADLQGVIALAQGRAEDAVQSLQRASAVRDSSVLRVRLATAQAKAGHPEAAEKTLASWIESHPDDNMVRLALGDAYLAAKRIGDARAQYAEIVRRAPDNAAAENNLAWSLSLLDRPKEALDHARHAATIAPDRPEVLDTLGVVLLQNGQPAEAAESLGKAVRAAPASLQIQLHLAEALVKKGDKVQARRILQELLKTGQTFDGRQQAQRLLEGLGS